MSRRVHPRPPDGRRISHAAIVCFSVAAIAFVACAMGLFVNHMLTGSLAISGTAAVGLIYLAMGVMNLGYEVDAEPGEVVIVASTAELRGGHDPSPGGDAPDKVGGDDADAAGATPFATEHASRVSTTRDVAYSTRD